METKNWIKCDQSNINGCHVYWQKSDDIYPLRYWKGKLEIPKTPFSIAWTHFSTTNLGIW